MTMSAIAWVQRFQRVMTGHFRAPHTLGVVIMDTNNPPYAEDGKVWSTPHEAMISIEAAKQVSAAIRRGEM